MNSTKVLVTLGATAAAIATLAVIWVVSNPTPTTREMADGYNALSEASKAAVYTRPESSQWALVQGDARLAYQVAMDTEVCAALVVEEGFSELLKDSEKGLSEPCGKICEVMDACQPAFTAFVVASKTSQVRSPVGLWSKWHAPGSGDEMGMLFLLFPQLMVIDAKRTDDWSRLFAAARYGQDLGRGESTIGLMIGVDIQRRVHAVIKAALEAGRLDTETQKYLVAELRYLDQQSLESVACANPRILDELPMMLDLLQDLPELLVPPRALRPRPGAKNGIVNGLVAGGLARAQWLSLKRLAALQGMSYPQRLKGHDEIQAFMEGHLNPLVLHASFDRFDARHTVVVAERRLLLTALGVAGLVDPFTEARFVTATVGDQTILESVAPKDANLFRVPGEFAERLKVTLTTN